MQSFEVFKEVQIRAVNRNWQTKMTKTLSKFVPGFDKSGLAILEPIVRSPVLQGYRNKCEFSVGHNPETNEVAVGFRLASYKKGSIAVVGVADIPIVSEVMKAVVTSFESFVRTSGWYFGLFDHADYEENSIHQPSFNFLKGLKPFNNISQIGHWKQLTVRTSRNGDVMVWAILHPQNMTDDDKKKLKEKIVEHFDNEQGLSYRKWTL